MELACEPVPPALSDDPDCRLLALASVRSPHMATWIPLGGAVLRHRLVLGTAGVGDEGVLSRAQRSWFTWLTFKQLGTEASRRQWTNELGLHTVDDRRWQTRTGTSSSARWRLTEDLDTGRWTSTLTAVELPPPARVAAGITGWVELTVESETIDDDADDAAPRAFLPRIHRYLTSLDGWCDGPAPVTGIQIVDRKQVPWLVQVLTDPRRRLPAFVLSQPPTRVEEWQSAAESLAARTRGLGSVWQLEREATDELQARLGHDLSVWGGAARTYMPMVRPHDRDEMGFTSRHRVVSLDKFLSRADYFTNLLAYRAAEVAVDLALPTPAPAALDVIPVASRHLRELKVASPVVEAAAAERPEALPDPRVADLSRQLQDALSMLQSARDDYAVAMGLASDAEQNKSFWQAEARLNASENAAGAVSLARPAPQLRDLRTALLFSEKPQLAEEGGPRPDPGDLYPEPDSFADLLELLSGDIDGVHFTGDPKVTRVLDRHSNRRAWLTKAWEAVLAMADYAEGVRLGEYSGLFSNWCEDVAPTGRRVLPVGPGRMLIPSESGTVKDNATMAAQRLLPVPVEVEPGGRAYMWAHVRLGGGGNDAPRLHYLESGHKVYIGFIGQHLDNTKTN